MQGRAISLTALLAGAAGAQPAGFSRPADPALAPRMVFAAPAPQAQPQYRGPSFIRVVGQLVGGTLGAWAGGIIGYTALDGTDQRRVDGDAGYSPNGNTGYAVGSWIGSTAAIHFIGRGDGSRAPLMATAIGTGIPTIPLLLGRDDGYLALWGVMFGAPAQAVLGTGGYHVGRKRD